MMYFRNLTLILALFVFHSGIYSQIQQNAKGIVVDADSKYPLIGAQVRLASVSDSTIFKTITNGEGEFVFNQAPVGKYDLSVNYAFYISRSISITIDSGKETFVQIELQEDITTTDEVQVVARNPGEVLNEMATVSAQQFSIEETERYAGSRADPARMASNFAGVQGADDSRNDIIIRGNSPLGLLYRVEGLDIPNPNHFAVSGSAGGPVAILNNKILANSDFFMSAFPAEYGNSIAGVFDLRFRNGNKDLHEITGQFGFLGTEVMAEGPINPEKKSSYLAMGRYSTLSMFQAAGVSIGTDAVPVYGDGAFKLSYPTQSGGNFSVWGMGGASTISIKISDQTTFTEEAFGESDRDQYFTTSMGVIGTTYKKSLSESTYLKASLGTSWEMQRSNHDFLIRSIDTSIVDGEQLVQFRTDSIYPLMGYTFLTNRASSHLSITHKLTKKHIIRFGFNSDYYYLQNSDSSLNAGHDVFQIRHDFQGGGLLFQPYFQYKWRVNPSMDFTAGIHSQYFSLSNSYSIAEPRLGWQLRLKNNQTLKAGAGLHSQMQPLYQYTYQRYNTEGIPQLINKNMDFTRSIHTAIGYEKVFKNAWNVKAETYFQYLYGIPVDEFPSAFSLINQGAGFQRFFPNPLVNEGNGRNYGVELTVQKFFSKTFYMLFTASLFESQYRGSDQIWRNTDFNSRYAANFLAGKEFAIDENKTFSVGLKLTGAGGRWYGFVDNEASLEANELVFLDSAFNTRQFRDYFRFDLKVMYKVNRPKVTHELGLDLVNILNTQNILALSYAPSLIDPSAEPVAERYQLGFLPIFYYRADLRLKNKKSNGSTE